MSLQLLKILIDPCSKLDFAHVLRSPLFSISHKDLIEIISSEKLTWNEKLEHFLEREPSCGAAHFAYQQLSLWQQLVDRIPVHDLLSQIYSDINIHERYQNASPKEDSQQIIDRLNQFLHQSLEIDSGRYSSISRFLRKVKESNPDVISNADISDSNVVTVMTVHAAKGLEAPIVFIADCGPASEPPDQFKSVIDWPASSPQPTLFMLGCRQSGMSASATQVINDIDKFQNEKLNLLYVAMSRAKQILIISGIYSKKSSANNWHKQICSGLEIDLENTYQNEFGNPPAITTAVKNSHSADNLQVHPKIYEKLPYQKSRSNNQNLTNPSKAHEGTIIHKVLEILSIHPSISMQALSNLVTYESNLFVSSEELDRCKNEALACLSEPSIHEAFAKDDNKRIFNEVSVADAKSSNQINIIDKLIINNDIAWILDFKTQEDISRENAEVAAREFIPQLLRYANSISLLYPTLTIRCSIIFTKIPLLIDVDID